MYADNCWIFKLLRYSLPDGSRCSTISLPFLISYSANPYQFRRRKNCNIDFARRKGINETLVNSRPIHVTISNKNKLLDFIQNYRYKSLSYVYVIKPFTCTKHIGIFLVGGDTIKLKGMMTLYKWEKTE